MRGNEKHLGRPQALAAAVLVPGQVQHPLLKLANLRPQLGPRKIHEHADGLALCRRARLEDRGDGHLTTGSGKNALLGSRYSVIDRRGFLRALTAGMGLAPLVADAQPARSLPTIGYL